MASFGQVLERMQNESVKTSENPEAAAAVRAGLNLNADFWDDFIKICNQSKALSELLGVRRDVIARWPNEVRKALAQIERQDSAEAMNKKASLITTGYN
ncbi:MAG: hypothetical protein DWQ19_11795 [Crenarchaeota archaeon]|nr:MAG: hypothetical protein DWQ19_11795 [Thermoproteota archaeon]